MRVTLLAESMLDYATAFAAAVAPHAEVQLLAPERTLGAYRGELPPELGAPTLGWPRLRSLANAPFLGRLVGVIRDFRPDLIHVLSQTLTWPALILPLRGAVPLIETVHDVTPHPGDVETQRIPPQFMHLLRAQADALIVHREGLRAEAARRFSIGEDRIHVIPHLALTRYRRFLPPRAPTDDRFDLLFFGRVYAYKGLEHLIAAAEHVADRIPSLRVTIAGAGDDLARCRALIKRPNLFDIRARYIPADETAMLFARSDAVVLPYIEASQSGVLAMALPFGKPVIASDVGDFRETLTGGPAPAGLLVPPGDPGALAAAILSLYENPPLRAGLARAGKALAEGPLSAAAIGAAALRIYRSMRPASKARGAHAA
jgi:glycosyltransferase involved in cell wall biosynthesis